MGITLSKSIRKTLRRWKRSRKLQLYAAVGLVCIGAIGYAIYMDTRKLSVEPTSYNTLLDLIARVESTDNYNAHFGNPANSKIKFTDMTIEEVREWQREFIAQGNASSAVGRYQIIDTTLDELITQLNLGATQKFDKTTQDKLAIALLERRGSSGYINRELTPEEFAANLAMEWAALPKINGKNGNASYYAGDGLNAALVKKEAVLHAIQKLQPE